MTNKFDEALDYYQKVYNLITPFYSEIVEALTIASKLKNDPYTATFDRPEPFHITGTEILARRGVKPLDQD